MEDSFLERNVISFDFDKVDKSTVYNYNFKAIPIRYENYKNVFLSIITDTTDTRNREVALKISEEKFNLALEQTSVDIWELDIVNNYLYLSDAFANRYGYATTSFKLGIGMFSQYNIIHKDYTKKLEEFYINILAGKKSGECKIKMLDKFKRYQLVKLSYKTIFDNNNNPITAVGVATIVNTNLGVYTMFNQEEKIANILKNQLLFSAQYNITDGVVKNIVGKENFISTSLHDKLTYDKIFNIILNTVAHEVDYQECENILSEDNLINSIANNKYYQTINYRRVNEKGIISWVTLTLVFLVEPTSGDEYVFIYILDTDKKYKLELSLPVKAEYDITTKIYIKDTMKRLTNFAINSEEISDNDCAFVIFELNNYLLLNSNTVLMLLKNY
jgi:PAS domain-containing protein